jgi:ribosomal protein S12 methylthiotransferase
LKIALITLGCDKNTVDGEHLAGVLTRRGHEIAVEGAQTAIDVLVVLTCGFIRDARDQSFDTIRAYCETKTRFANPRRIVVAGCLSQRSAVELAAEYPEVDAFAGVGRTEEVAEMIERVGLGGSDGSGLPARPGSASVISCPPPLMKVERALPRRKLDDLPYAFLKIADGCSHACAFCAIPAMKGPYVSVPREIVLEEARALVAAEARELNLIAQDLVPYGRDLYADYALPDLLEDLCRIEGDFWIRLLYFYPMGLTPRFIEVFAREPKICKYLDIPLQHLDPGILRAMRRPAGDDAAQEQIARLRTAVPDVAIRTTMIVGFPGETSEAFKRLLRGVEEIRFDWLGAFQYSPEEGTPARDLLGQVPPKTALRRQERLLQTQQRITSEILARQVGRQLRVLIESVSEDGREARGRSQREAPEVDGSVIVSLQGVPKAARPRPGDFLNVRITEARIYDLVGRPVERRTARGN